MNYTRYGKIVDIQTGEYRFYEVLTYRETGFESVHLPGKIARKKKLVEEVRLKVICVCQVQNTSSPEIMFRIIKKFF